PNVIELVAQNERAAPPYDDLETRRVGPVVVTYTPEPTRPPTIRLDGLTVLPRDPNARPEVVALDGPTPDPVASPTVRLAGRVEAKEKLTEAEWWSDERRGWVRFAGFTPGASTAFNFRQELILAPGRNTLRVRARAGDAGAGAGRHEVVRALE